MTHTERPSISRRGFLSTTAVAFAEPAALAAGPVSRGADGKRERLAIVGTGGRGTGMWGKPAVEEYGDVCEIVGLCDINSRRVRAAQSLMGTKAPCYTDFEQMVRETKPDRIIVTTVDATHYRYIIWGLELGCAIITEKPLCTDERQCRAILDAQRKTGGDVTVTFNDRYLPESMLMKQLLMEKAIGNIISVNFHEYLDTSHGADYFRRWHHLKENSGTLLVHKASHHFDLTNWWLDSRPLEVSAGGDLRFYGRNNQFRGTHCRGCAFKPRCQFQWDVTADPENVKLYVECESEDGYLRDACVWRESTNIYDTMSVRAKYENGTLLSYTADTYLPYEGQAISLNGTLGRLDWNTFGGGGFASKEIRLTRRFARSEVLRPMVPKREGDHGGSDSSIRDRVFRNPHASDTLGQRADLLAGAYSSLLGIAAYRSIERDGRPVKIAELLGA